ncbi:MAG TPA: flagellar motor protein MotB [Hypericibacter adhaerens]|jgi:chemotaxis protein MotB|uniref:Membrane protein n=1 Tax=Hypericibacter adhaerens TaxID=2602016 RepID=A0A5J6N4H7_9PROT|nr:flagellar motor protein MotB [Hypericibacter adhaerens]QEX21806.1 membrane protein [Hypericibacter adhaerens]HWA46187.1 flagellar motor protein MotB [Hypericibacter adhaerens]
MAETAAGTNQPPIIIKKKKRGGGHGHHGGAWKVAYADFVTAMMAFFLLLWLLNATTEEQRIGIANYFAPSVAPDSTSGSNGVMGGQTITTDGAMVAENSTPSVTVEINTPPTETDGSDGGATATNATEEAAAAMAAAQNDTADQQAPTQQANASDQEAQKLLKELEDEQFRQAEHQLRQAIQQVPDLKTLAQNLIIDRTPEGMRIQLVDQDRISMFSSGSAKMEDYTKKLLDLVAQVVTKMPNKISISGHTDSTPYQSDNGYSNWELSADRANASRRELLAAGLSPDRIANVVGKADTDPLLPDDTSSPRNRRISIVLLHEQQPQPQQ